METYFIPTDLNAIGFVVKAFPNGIGQAFEELVAKIPGGFSRPYYGIAECIDGKMIYKAAALEKEEGEAEKLNLEKYIIPKGEYLAVRVTDWKNKTDKIKDIFAEMYKDERADHSTSSIEIYENEKDMLCLVKIDETKKESKYALREDAASRN